MSVTQVVAERLCRVNKRPKGDIEATLGHE
jgi:hypothetical protein